MVDAAMMYSKKTCFQAYREKPYEFRRYLIAGGLFGFGLGLFLWGAFIGWQSSTAATEPVVVAPLIVNYRADGSIMLKGRYIVPTVNGCTRQISYLMYRPLNAVESEFVNLGMALGGDGIKATAAAYTIHLHVPANLPSGNWDFIMRVYYTCQPLGTIHKAFSTHAVTIRVP